MEVHKAEAARVISSQNLVSDIIGNINRLDRRRERGKEGTKLIRKTKTTLILIKLFFACLQSLHFSRNDPNAGRKPSKLTDYSSDDDGTDFFTRSRRSR
jgi:hypothetical protein